MNLNLTAATRIGLNLSAMLGISVALYLGASIFIPLTIAVLLASVLFPGVKFLHDKLLFPWFFSTLFTILGVIALFLVVFGAFAIAIPRTIEGLPKQEDGPNGWKEQYKKIQGNLAQIIPYRVDEWLPPDPDKSRVYTVVREAFSEGNVLTAVSKIAKVLLEYLWQGTLILFITLFLLIEGQMLADKVRAIFGTSAETQRRVSVALAEMAEAIRKYLVWRTIVNLGLGIFLGSIYNLLGLQYWYLWALLVMVLSYVPYLGTIAAGIPPIIDALLFVDPLTAIVIAIIYTCVVTFEGYIIIPWVMGRSMDLNATTVLMACLFWDLVWGMAGLFLAMPIMAAIKAICLQVDGWQGWGDLMSSGPAKPIKLETDPDMKRFDAIAKEAVNGEGTVIINHLSDSMKEDSPATGEPKSDGY